MDSTLSVLPDAVWNTRLEDGRRVQLRPCGKSKQAAVLALAASSALHLISAPMHCLCRRGVSSDSIPLPEAMLAAFTSDEAIVGAAWLEHAGSAEAQLAVGVQPALLRSGLAADLVAAIAEEARARNIRRLTACAPQDAHDLLSDFRKAGLRVSSSMCLGGVTDVVIDLE